MSLCKTNKIIYEKNGKEEKKHTNNGNKEKIQSNNKRQAINKPRNDHSI
jgi:hypothetical protein